MQQCLKAAPLLWNSPHGRRLPAGGGAPILMGVLNVSRDSFSDGGKYLEPEAAKAQFAKMIFEGAEIVDIGAESTRPDAQPLSAEEELELLLPRLSALRKEFPDAPISVDTYKPEVARAAVEAGADIINDVRSEEVGGAIATAAEAARLGCPIILTHNCRGEKRSGEDFFEGLKISLAKKAAAAEKSGVPRSRIVLDPGVGFGKSAGENFEIVSRLGELGELGFPVLLGVSRKSMFAQICGSDMRLRDISTAAVSAFAAAMGSAQILRVHDVAASAAAIKTVLEILKWTKS